MATIARTYGSATANPVATGSTIIAAHINTDMDTIYADYNGNITNANIASAAAIAASKTTIGTFTNWTAWTPTFGGFSANPTYLISRYMQIGNVIIYRYVANADGTSNATTFTMTIPGTPVLTGGRIDFSGFLVNDSTSGGTYFGNATVTSGSTLNIYRITGTFPVVSVGQSFANSGNKGIAGGMTLIYEV